MANRWTNITQIRDIETATGPNGGEILIVQTSGDGPGGETAVTIADGDFETFGAMADAAATTDVGTFTFMSLFKRLLQKITTQLPAALTGSGNLKTAVQEALPAGTNNIGDVDVLSLPVVQVQGDVAHDAVDSGNPVEIGGYAADTAPAAVTLGDRVRAWFTRVGALATFNAYGLNRIDDSIAVYPPGTATRVDSAALEASRVLKAAPGVLLSLHVLNTNAAVRYIQVFDSATVPADATVPDLVIAVQATSSKEVRLEVPFTVGISIATSSTAGTKTLAAAEAFFCAVVI